MKKSKGIKIVMNLIYGISFMMAILSMQQVLAIVGNRWLDEGMTFLPFLWVIIGVSMMCVLIAAYVELATSR